MGEERSERGEQTGERGLTEKREAEEPGDEVTKGWLCWSTGPPTVPLFPLTLPTPEGPGWLSSKSSALSSSSCSSIPANRSYSSPSPSSSSSLSSSPSSPPYTKKSSEITLPRVSAILPCSSESLSSLIESSTWLSSSSDPFQSLSELILLPVIILTTDLASITRLSFVLLLSSIARIKAHMCGIPLH